VRGRMPRSDEPALSPLHGSHFKEPQFQRVMPVSRAVWLRFTDTERQMVCSSKGQLPTVTSQAVARDSHGARMCVSALAHRTLHRIALQKTHLTPHTNPVDFPVFAFVSRMNVPPCNGGSNRLHLQAAGWTGCCQRFLCCDERPCNLQGNCQLLAVGLEGNPNDSAGQRAARSRKQLYALMGCQLHGLFHPGAPVCSSIGIVARALAEMVGFSQRNSSLGRSGFKSELDTQVTSAFDVPLQYWSW